jgi:hypothetical protein
MLADAASPGKSEEVFGGRSVWNYSILGSVSGKNFTSDYVGEFEMVYLGRMDKMIVLNMRSLTASMLTLIFVFGMNIFSVHSQEHPKATVQPPSQGPHVLAGCYKVVLLSWSPPDSTINPIPTQFELLSVPRVPGDTTFGIRSLGLEAGHDPSENLWSWRPKGKDKLEIVWGSAWGGFRGTLKKSGSELIGKLREYCDSRCDYKRRTGSLHLVKINCGPD